MKSIDRQNKAQRAIRRERSWNRNPRGFFLCLAITSVWIGSALAQTPQNAQQWIDKGLKDLQSQTAPKLFAANQAFTEAVKLEPSNHRALALKTITTLLLVPQDSALQKLLTDAGYTERRLDPATPTLTPIFDQPVDADGIFMPKAGAKTDQLLAYLNSRRFFIDGLLADLGKITDPQFKIELGEVNGDGGTTDMDYADVRALRAVMFLAKGLLALGNSHNLKLEYWQIYDLYAQGRLSMKELAGRLPNILKFADQAQRANSRQQLLRAEDETQAAILAFGQRTPLAEGRSFVFEIESAEEAQNTSEVLALLADALTGEVTLPQAPLVAPEFAGQRLNLSPLFTSSAPPRGLLPKGFDASGAFQRGTWPSVSLGEILPGLPGHLLDQAAAGLWFTNKYDSYFFLEPAIYRPYRFETIGELSQEWYSSTGGLALESNGNLLVVDNNGSVRRITPNGSSSIVFNADQIPDDNGYSWISGLGVDGGGRIYFSDGSRVFKRETGGSFTLLAGSFDYPPRDGSGAAASFSYISSMAVDLSGNVYVVDSLTAVRKISPTGQVTTLAGSAIWSDGSSGYKDGPGREARFSYILGSIGVDGTGNIYVCDSSNRAIRRIEPDGTTSTLVGGPLLTEQHYDGPIGEARLSAPAGLAVDGDGNIFFADGTTIRQLIPGQSVMTIGGQPQSPGSQDGAGRQARFGDGWSWQPNFLAVGRDAELLLATQKRVLSAERAPIITTQPASVEAEHGENVTFTVASGAQNPRYQWFKNGQPIRGATQVSITITASLATAGIYSVKVSGDLGTETSSAASLQLLDSGLLVYNLAGTGFAAGPYGKVSRRETAVVVVDRLAQGVAFIWHAAGPDGKFYRVEYPDETSMHSTGPFAGSISVLTRAAAAGSHPEIEKDVLWFTGADSLNRLNSKTTPPIHAIAPARMTGTVQTLSLSDGVLVEALNASMTLDAPQTLRTRTGAGERLASAVNRIASEFTARGYTNRGP